MTEVTVIAVRAETLLEQISTRNQSIVPNVRFFPQLFFAMSELALIAVNTVATFAEMFAECRFVQWLHWIPQKLIDVRVLLRFRLRDLFLLCVSVTAHAPRCAA